MKVQENIQKEPLLISGTKLEIMKFFFNFQEIKDEDNIIND